MEGIKLNTNINHFALRAKLYQKAIRSAFEQLAALKAATA